MTVEILYVPDGPNYLPTVKRVQKALQQEHVVAEIRHVPVLDAATATATRFLGSPSVHINTVDVEPLARSDEAPAGLCCRTYRVANGSEGAPSVELIRGAIRKLAEENCCVQR